ncbi:TauD/TfdA dioxygenase family protein [Actinophytocola sp.]|uniref:TauD/TfdA dioxygenase family protein n=1 Tax=Actinophytocola sp. TaxID=1872138 RepID=UPI003D6A4742
MGTRAVSRVVVGHEPLTPNIGSVVSGVDFSSRAAVESCADELRALLLDRQVLFFRDLGDLRADVQEAFAGVFGVVAPVGDFTPTHLDSTNVEVLHTKGKAVGTDIWHADRTWHATPPSATCLYANKVPAVGGDTMWASMTVAVEALDSSLREHLSKLECVHSWESESHKDTLGEQRYAQMRTKYPPRVRPVIETHPVSGKPILYVNSLYSTRILGVPQAQADALLRYLTSLASVPEYQVRWRWKPGAMAVWDNWAVQHYAVSDYFPHERIMHRVTVV